MDLSPGTLSTKTVDTTDLRLSNRPTMIQCYSPATLQYLGEVKIDTPNDVERVIQQGRKVQVKWAQTTFAERRRVLQMMKQVIINQQDDIVKLSCIDTGKTRVDAQFGEILSSLGKLDWVINDGEEALKPEYRPTNFTSMHKKARVEYHPLGVIGVIAPWNYPFYNLYNHISAALFAGNAVVLKMSEYSAWSGERYIRVARDVLAVAGYSPDLVQIIQGFGETGAALVQYADKVIFTGSPGIGKLVMKGASTTLTPLVLELGGKDPLLICEDVPVKSVLPIALRGTYQNAGQNCVGIERIYVYESIYDEFVKEAAEAVKNFRVGPSFNAATGDFAEVDVGAITTAPQLALIQELVDDAVKKGAILECGGKILYQPINSTTGATNKETTKKSSGGRRKSISKETSVTTTTTNTPSATNNGLFYAPTVLSNVTHDMRIANEEVFGPVMAIFKVAKDSDDTAIAMANSTSYGLGGTVYCNNPVRANQLANRIRSGMIGVNAYGLNYLVQSLPFGGVGISGFNRFSGAEGIRECCITKSVVSDYFSFLSIPTPVPTPLQYPLKSYTPDFVKVLLNLQFAPSLWEKIVAALSISFVGMGSKNNNNAGSK